jgi:plastocyanin
MKPLHVLLTLLVIIVIGTIWLKGRESAPVSEAQPVVETPTGNAVTTEIPAVETANTAPHEMMMDTDTQGEMKMFNVTGTNFAYDVTEIRVRQGDTVMIHLMSNGGTHDFVIDELGIKSDLVKQGGMEMITFTASKKGTFEYYCSVGSHRANGMVGKLIVE